jgi:hypothetical protein
MLHKKAETEAKPRKRGTVSAVCPVCGANSGVTITSRVEGIVIRTRKCLGKHPHTFKTKEISIAS